MRRQAGAGNGHAKAKDERGDGQQQAHRPDMCGRRQPVGLRCRHPGTENRSVADGTDGQGDEDGKDSGGVALFDEVTQVAVKAEARTLQHKAKDGPGEQGKAQYAAFGPARGGKHQGGSDDAGGDGEGDKETER